MAVLRAWPRPETLLQGGAAVTVLEAQHQVGGLAASHRIGEHRVDLGPHRLHREASPEVLRLLSQGSPLGTRPRLGRIHLHEKILSYPLSPWRSLRELGLQQSLCLGAGLAWSRFPLPSPYPRGSYGHEASRTLGHQLFELLYAPAARKIWGRDPAELDPEHGRSRIGAGNAWGVVKRALGQTEPGSYFYPSGGFNGLAYGAWAEALRKRGGVLLCNAGVESIEHDGRQVGKVLFRKDAQQHALKADRVISTLPLPHLLRCLHPRPETIRSEAFPMRWLIALYAVINRSRFQHHDVSYFPSEQVPFARLTEQRAFGSTPGAPPKETVLGMDFYEEAQGPWCNAAPGELLNRAWPTLAQLGLRRSEVQNIHKVVAANAYPVFVRGFQNQRSQALEFLANLEGLISTGRGGLLLHVNQHHAVEMGLAAGRAALALQSSSRRWRARAHRFESCRVVD